MRVLKNIIAVYLLFCVSMASAQNDSSFWNKNMLEIAYKGDYIGWVNIKEELNFSKNDFFVKNKNAFLLTSNDSMRLVSSTERDELGYTRHLFQQTYRGVEIENAQYKLHEKDDRIFCANGYMVQELACSTEPTISEEKALLYALEYIGAEKYAWEVDYMALLENEEDKEERDELRLYYEETPAYHYPKGTLLFTRFSDNLPMGAENFVLAYKFEILTVEPSSSNEIYVNAHTGEVFKMNSLKISSNCHNGTALTKYNGYQTIVTKKRSGSNGNYILKDECRGNGIKTLKQGSVFSGAMVHYTDADNQWSLNEERPGTSVHWAMGNTYDYFSNVHGRNGHYKSKQIISVILNDVNSYWVKNSHIFQFGLGNGITLDALTSLDIVAHEYTHAIIHDKINLNGSYESGALNESFADIFGATVEFYYLGDSGNYYIGEMFVLDTFGMLRDMSNPNNINHPKTYYGTNWEYGSIDYGGIHTNSGVQNYWFYLLAEGDNSNNYSGYDVQGIGRDKAAEIVYRSLTNGYLTSNSQYIDAAISSTRAAMELYGNNSCEAIQVYRAWQAVGIHLSPSVLLGYNGVNCAELTSMAMFSNNVSISRMNQIVSNCDISSITKPVVFQAGNEIRLLPGFKSNGNFHAYITSCEDNGSGGGSGHKSLVSNDAFFINEGNDYNNESINNESITIFPNPNNGSFTIKTNSLESIEKLEVVTMLGQVVYSVQHPRETTITLPTGVKGAFFVRITTQTESVTQKIIVE